MQVNGGQECMSFASKVICGFGAGALGAAVGNPSDLVMVRVGSHNSAPLAQTWLCEQARGRELRLSPASVPSGR